MNYRNKWKILLRDLDKNNHLLIHFKPKLKVFVSSLNYLT
jgi:hypothetical protein